MTGDDVLIEYVQRIINDIKQLNESDLKLDWMTAIDRFIKHYVWHTPDLKVSQFSAPLWKRLESRLNEMKDRRKRLVKSVYKKEG